MSKVANIKTLHSATFGKRMRPTKKSIAEVLKQAAQQGRNVGDDGRFYASFKQAAPIVNGVRMRWQDGELVPRVLQRR